ncbi:uncharacterized protein LOC120338420 isoform X4 [Styela clava]
MNLAILLTFITVAFAQEETRTFTISPGYSATYFYNHASGVIVFSITASVRPGHWAAIGFSKDRKMEKSDAVIGYISSGNKATVVDVWIDEKSQKGVQIDKHSDANNPGLSSWKNGVLEFTFTRLLDSDDDQDLSLTQCRYFLFAWDGPVIDFETFGKHSRREISTKKICIGFPGTAPDSESSSVGSQVVTGGNPPVLVANCGEPPKVSNAKRSFEEQSAFGVGSIIFYQCDNGYKIKGSISVTCISGGTWDPEPPQCIKEGEEKSDGDKDGDDDEDNNLDPCSFLECPDKASCVVENGFADCQCDDGYEFNDDDECVSKDGKEKDKSESGPCRNLDCPDNAECVVEVDLAVCKCDDGYDFNAKFECVSTTDEKDFARNPRDPCRRLICPENGRCVAENGKPSCVCDPGFGLARDGCFRNPCDMIMCPPNSKCSGGICLCDPDHMIGIDGNCYKSESRDPCDDIKCDSMAICVDGDCKCPDDYFMNDDDECEKVDKDPCDEIKCKDSIAKCRDGICECPDGYFTNFDGKCEKKESQDPCEDVKCDSIAQCIDGECRCPDDFFLGDSGRCERELFRDACANVKCDSIARCVDGVCKCPREFILGDSGRCERGISNLDNSYFQPLVFRDPCDDIECDDMATCVNGFCECPKDYFLDDDNKCQPEIIDPCDRITCHPSATCFFGKCECPDGHSKRSDGSCKSKVRDPCEKVKCHHTALCFQGFCECPPNNFQSSDGSCSLVDRDPCYGVRCHSSAFCVRGTCACRDKYVLAADGKCNPVFDKCAGRTCPVNSDCINGVCQCTLGYNYGIDGFCKRLDFSGDPCSTVRCPTNARCTSREGVAYCICIDGYHTEGLGECVVNYPCYEVDCKFRGVCVVKRNRGSCECIAGYRRTQNGRCERLDSCSNVRCDQNSRCVAGKCQCIGEYVKGVDEICRKPDACSLIKCPIHSKCQITNKIPSCICTLGYEMNSRFECVKKDRDRCAGITCPINSSCKVIGSIISCLCNKGYVFSNNVECVAEDPCLGIPCGPFSVCKQGKCECLAGYLEDWQSGDCKAQDECYDVRCPIHSSCVSGVCKCNAGYSGNPVYGPCRVTVVVPSHSCTGVVCGSNSRCTGGICICMDGYIRQGDICTEPSVTYDGNPSRCDGYSGHCGAHATCVNGLCVCITGYTIIGGICSPELCHGKYCPRNSHCNKGSCECDQGFNKGTNNICYKASTVIQTCLNVCGRYYIGGCSCESTCNRPGRPRCCDDYLPQCLLRRPVFTTGAIHVRHVHI